MQADRREGATATARRRAPRGIEEAFAIAKSEAGLDEHQVRRWTAWYRHAILSMLAAAFLAVTRTRVPANPTAWPAR